MPKMWNNYPSMLWIMLWYMFAMGKIEAQSPVSVVAVYQVPVQPNILQSNPVVDALARSISDGLQHSPVLGIHANFVLFQPYDLFYEVGEQVLTRAGINDMASVEADAEAAREVGIVTSKLYFDTIGYSMANVLYVRGIATADNVKPLTLSVVNAVGVVACVDGLSDTRSVLHATVNGLFNVLESYGQINYANGDYLFYLFAEYLKRLSNVI